MSQTRVHRLLLGVVVAAVVLPAVASAQRATLQDAPPIRQPLKWRAERHQVAPQFGFTVNDTYSRAFSVGLTYRYYFYNWFGLGADILATYATMDTALTEKITAELTQPGRSGQPSTAAPGFLANATLTFVPLYGKMMWFGTLPVSYDLQIDVGAGLGRTTTTGLLKAENLFAPMWGIGTRLFFNDWVALEIGIKDYFMNYAPRAPAGDTEGAKEWTQNFVFTVGVSFFLMPTLEHEQ